MTDPKVISYLRLCQLSYLPLKAIPTAVAGLPPLDPGGTWQCVWAAQSADQANLAYVAVYFESTRVPAFAAVAIRGTDAVVDPWGVIVQMWEDLDVLDPVPYPWMPASSGALVAGGTLDGLLEIQHLTDGGQRLLPFLTGFFGEPQHQQAQLVVTGHSLGGCLTTVVAPWLQVSLSQQGIDNTIVPVTFAAPTAGNSDFASQYFLSVPSSLRYFNTLDIVPLAWESLAAIKTVYDSDGLPAPELVDVTIDAVIDLMDLFGVSYAQPGQDCKLTGTFLPSPPSWYDEAYYQHHTTTYMKLLGGTSVAAEWPRPRIRSRV